jgi:hypothetical protein
MSDFKNFFAKLNNTNENTSQNILNNKKKKEDDKIVSDTEKTFNNPYVIGGIILFVVIFVMYIFINIIETNKEITSYTYLNKDLTNNKYLFDSTDENQGNIVENPTIKECIDRCKIDPLCDGITYDNQTQKCIGIEEGTMRKDEPNFIAWEKPKESKFDKKEEYIILASLILNPTIVKNLYIPPPPFIGQFMYSFWINISDWYENFNAWKHVFHKGSELDYKNVVDYVQWDNIVQSISDQSIGVWLTPFTNNLRICLTTSLEKNLRKPEKKPVSISETYQDLEKKNITGNYIELYTGDYYNGKKIKLLAKNGYYNFEDLYSLGYEKSSLSSIKIPKGVRVTLFKTNIQNKPSVEKAKNLMVRNNYIVLDHNVNNLKQIYKSDEIVNFNNNVNSMMVEVYSKIEYEKNIEYYDIKNVPINRPFHIAVNVNNKYMEIFMNGNIVNIIHLEGTPETNNGNMYIKYNKSFFGEVNNLSYVPEYTKKTFIKKLSDPSTITYTNDKN